MSGGKGGTARTLPRICVSDDLLDVLLAQASDLSASDLARFVTVEGAEDWPQGRELAGRLLEARIAEIRRYRLLLQATVIEAAPLVDRLPPQELRAALDRVRPPASDPDHRLGGFAWRHAWRSPVRTMRHPRGAWDTRTGRELVESNFLRLFRRDGIIATGGDDEPVLGLRVVGRGLEIGIRVGESVVITLGGMAKVVLPGRMPETIAAAVVGRMLDQVVDSPIFADRGYLVRQACAGVDGTVITAATGVVPITMPWGSIARRADCF